MRYFESIALSVFAVFAPIHAAIVSVFVLVGADAITGVMAAKKQKKKITSSGFKDTVAKLFLYQTALCLSFLVQQYLTGDALPAAKLVSAMIGITELKSILENLDVLNGEPVFGSLIKKLTQQKESQ